MITIKAFVLDLTLYYTGNDPPLDTLSLIYAYLLTALINKNLTLYTIITEVNY